MKKFLIYLSSILLLFGASVAFAGVYIEDFEDGIIDPPFRVWAERYEIIEDIFHMTEGIDFPEIGLQGAHIGIVLDNELIYKFEADVYSSPINGQDVGLEINLYEPSGGDWSITLYIQMDAELSFIVAIQKDGETIRRQVLEPANHGQWYSLSISLHDDYISVSIDNNEIDLFEGSFQKPTSISASHGEVKGQVPIPNDLDYYVDYMKAYTSTEAKIDDILYFLDECVANGTIYGRGRKPWRANARLWTFRQMLESAKRQLDNGRVNRACRTLNRIESRCDGEPWPNDFIKGDAVPDLYEMILDLIEIKCE